MATDDKPDFTVVDRRRAAESDAGAAAESRPGAAEAPPVPGADAPDAAAGAGAGLPYDAEALPALAMRDRLLMCIDILGQGAWIAMGLVADPATGEIQKDLPGCKNAIDCVEAMAGMVEGDLEVSVRRDLKNLVSDLKINYVQQMNR